METLDQKRAPNLTGSEKQIKWATEIREAILAQADGEELIYNTVGVRRFLRGHLNSSSRISFDEALPHINRALDRIKQQADAAWWIDRRTENINTLIQQTIKSEAQ